MRVAYRPGPKRLRTRILQEEDQRYLWRSASDDGFGVLLRCDPYGQWWGLLTGSSYWVCYGVGGLRLPQGQVFIRVGELIGTRAVS